MSLSITLIIIIITVLVSISGFNNQKIIDDLIFYPPAITKHRQWYRFFTCGFIHADVPHLLFNMFSLYLFGGRLEYDPEPGRVDFMDLFGDNGKIYYLLMYILALFVCLLPTFVRHKNNYNYRSLGASGAVSAVIFASIILHPLDRLGFYFIPPVIPAYIFGALYLIISTYMGKRSRDNINHSAHIWGALFGIAYLVVLAYILHTDYKPLQEFIEKIKGSLGIN